MAIDYMIDYPCVPRATFGSDGILERLKAGDRAKRVIALFRESGDVRPPSEMGFEMVRSTPEGGEETRVVIVQEMIDAAGQLDTTAHHCIGCPANRSGQPYGCAGYIQYPFSLKAERWLLDQLPGIEEPLIWLLLRQSVQEMNYTGDAVKPLRANPTYFEERRLPGRNLGEFTFSGNQIFEMLFLLGHIRPARAGMLLLFFNAMLRDLEADQIVEVTTRGETLMPAQDFSGRYPFKIEVTEEDDKTLAELKGFFEAMYRAWALSVALLLDV